MAIDLGGYSIEQISEAFTIWRNDEEKIPTTAGIKKILLKKIRERARMAELQAPNVFPPNVNDRDRITDEEKQDFDDWLEEQKKKLKGLNHDE